MCNNLIEKVKKYNPEANTDLIEKAFKFSKKVHQGQFRLSGDPFVAHPLKVAEILAGLEQDTETICAALLHDVIEDTSVTQEGLIQEFGKEIYTLVEGVTKLGRLVFESKEERQAENFRKMFLAMGQDIRIIIVKLADRLHNMQTLKYLPKPKIKDTSLETREIFAPLAHRLGIWNVKWELEDLSFRYLEPDKFEEVKEKIAESRGEREQVVSTFIRDVKDHLKMVTITAEIYGRPKHFYSIYRKMVEQNLEFEELYDLLAIRIIVDGVKECYAALGIIHAAWKPIPGRFRDYVAMPKSNGYQSLHTTVIGPRGRPVEIQIRTKEMHRTAEYGIASHWKYKEGETDQSLDTKMAWLRQLIDSQEEIKSAKDFLESIKVDLFVGEVFVFTPQGKVIDLPVNATPIDFAYRVHTEVGHRCIGAKVNGRIVPLDHKLKNGDILEIITGKIDSPSLDWLNVVKTSGAKNKLKSWFKKRKTEENVGRGEANIRSEIKKLGLRADEVMTDEHLLAVAKEFGLPSIAELFAAIGYGEYSAYQIARKLRTRIQKQHGVPPVEEELVQPLLVKKGRKGKKKQGIRVADLENVQVRFSKCCKPLPGDEIVGFVTKGRGIAVHRADCPNVVTLPADEGRKVEVSWDNRADIIYSVDLEVEAFDRVGVLKDILEKVASIQTNLSAANVRTKRGSSAIIKLVVDIKDTEHLALVLNTIREVSDVYDAYRADIARESKRKGAF
ncbi:MAG: bifunctional (p)ppGpp synthetase/guanosine-3',5'-bis(diphosphate) 3'-pyrophosphohydrolase [Candidatus Margulisbacteria bacterium]|nr:bifunctional (p)ppGpp synthetase/guanosine-3',5'-bis(diphosphate) 3'-pyrophosphohydrolase [Candidatus Margulisiibacteriota bacterium]MBU1021319.1 bifunctional (p)ppGpp synthetase/guanosine-3',5'-bis(diphosphate) 3'-pyrophosphohydrolase [Candidatus Margulisiibacteriota bacterium]MBU1729192.1 bifunctional (p)ppGpp synthetase/guanosine-3',5'-bis(diphosphate) 3'-pyrophosphohydrolase [Candidatus Margulisiibacteriota bacterium]MBU1954865.1 bifunctional (p)ppGpp synthetase/guanosine-3',5'-bis(diphos